MGGTSNKIAVLDNRSNMLSIYKLDGDEEIQVQLSTIASDISPTLEAANFIMGNLVCLCVIDSNFQFVTRNGEVIDGNKQEIKHYVNEYTAYHIDVGGMVVLSNTDDMKVKVKLFLYNN